MTPAPDAVLLPIFEGVLLGAGVSLACMVLVFLATQWQGSAGRRRPGPDGEGSAPVPRFAAPVDDEPAPDLLTPPRPRAEGERREGA